MVLSAMFGLGVLTSCGLVEGKGAAEKVVASMHEQFNAETYSETYLTADADFRRATTLAAFTELMQAVHRKLGTFVSANQTSANVFASGSLTTVTLVSDSTFVEGKATEQYKFSISSGRAFLLAYNINSPVLILK
jgi:hypothetical protein